MKLEGQYVKSNTLFCKPLKSAKKKLNQINVVFITSDNLHQNIDALIKEDNINTIRLTTRNYKLNNLNFLKEYELDFITNIDILSDSIKDISGLYSLNNLVRINSINNNIDYSKFYKLKTIAGQLSSYSYKTLSNIKSLENILLSKFREEDLSIFRYNKNLKSLRLNSSKLKSLKGLNNFLQLEELHLDYNRSINSLEGIVNEHNQFLKDVYIYSAPKLFYINEYLSKLSSLEKLQLEGKNFDSFKFLDKLKSLSLLSIHNLLNNVDDDDKVPLINALKRTNSKIW